MDGLAAAAVWDGRDCDAESEAEIAARVAEAERVAALPQTTEASED